VPAVDISAGLLELGRARVLAAHFIHASVYDVQILDFDAVITVGEPSLAGPDVEFRRRLGVLVESGNSAESRCEAGLGQVLKNAHKTSCGN
jgi:hypothetical protein